MKNRAKFYLAIIIGLPLGLWAQQLDPFAVVLPGQLNYTSIRNVEPDTIRIIDSLVGYYVGEYTHVNLDPFVRDLDVKINNRRPKYKVVDFCYTGFADAIPNSGIDGWRFVHPECQVLQTGLIDDRDLAYLRACMVRKKVHQVTNHYGLGLIAPLIPEDLPTGSRLVGGQYRKIIVEVVMVKK